MSSSWRLTDKKTLEQKLLSIEIPVLADFVGETTQTDLDANVSARNILPSKPPNILNRGTVFIGCPYYYDEQGVICTK